MDNNTIFTNKKNKTRTTKITTIIILAVAFVAMLVCCIILNSGKDGKDGENGTATAITGVDGKIAIDGENSAFDNENLSAMISVSANNLEYGKVSGSGRYSMNKAVIISAEPNSGYVFVRWQNENGEELSRKPSFLTRASEVAQTYIAVFEIDKNNVKIDVNVRADSSLPQSVTISGAGNYRYGEEYSLQISALSENDLKNSTILFYEVTKSQFEDENFVITDALKACAYGEKVIFDVDDVDNKYYIVAFKQKADDGTINIVIEVACDIALISSNDSYGTTAITKINGKNVGAEVPNIWQGDVVIAKATPTTTPKADDVYGIYRGVERANFVCWRDVDTGAIVSTDREYSFVAKRRVHLKAEFAPKTVLVYKAGESASRMYVNIISINNGIVYESSYYANDLDGALDNFEYGEKILIYASYQRTTSYGFTDRYNKFYWQISYDGTNWQTLSYDKQAYIEIPQNTPFVYIRINYERA